MPVRVICSADPRSLDRDTRFLALARQVHLFATRTMQLGWERSKLGSRLKLKHLSFRRVLKRLLHPWYSPSVVLQQYAALSHILTALPPSSHRRAFIRSQSSILDAMRTLIETGLCPSDYRGDDPNIALFRLVWAKMEARDARLSRPRAALYETATGFLERFAEALNESEEIRTPQEYGLDLLNNRTLVLHGFYFVSPIQYRVVELLDSAGITVIFFNHHDPRLPRAFSIWDRYFGDPRFPLLPPRERWESPSSLPMLPKIAQSFGELLSGRTDLPIQHDPRRVRIDCFRDFGSLLETLPEKRTNLPRLYAPRHDELSAVLRDFFPPESAGQEQHFLAYPIGQLLFHLHQMWDPEREQLRLNARAIRECFASGWLQVAAVNGRERLHDLEELLPFFEGCQTLEEWNARAGDLLSCVEGAAEAFQPPVHREHPNHRFHQFLSNPLLRLSYLRVPLQRVREVQDLIHRLSEIARVLFEESEVSLHGHFERIQREILDRVPELGLLARERELLSALKERLTGDADPDTRFLTRDLARAISYFLGGDMLDDPDDRPEQPLVERFDGLDGVLFDDGRAETWICLLSEDALPRAGGTLNWPIRIRAIEHLNDTPPVGLLLNRPRYAREGDVMLFFMALAWSRGPLRLSWIENWKGQKRVASPLLTLLMSAERLLGDRGLHQAEGALDGVAVNERSASSWDPEGDPAPDEVLGLPEPFDPDGLPLDAQATAAVCVRRFFYSFVGSEFPSFRSPFHHGFLFGNLTRAASTVGSSRDEPLAVADCVPHVRRLFPAWNDLQVRASMENPPPPRRGRTTWDGESYPDARARLQFLVREREKQKPMDIATGRSEPDRAKASAALQRAMTLDVGGLPEASPSTWCQYCPHIHLCDAAQYHMEAE